jgi:hypothetical protein
MGQSGASDQPVDLSEDCEIFRRENAAAAYEADLRTFEQDHARQFPAPRWYTETMDEEWWGDA